MDLQMLLELVQILQDASIITAQKADQIRTKLRQAWADKYDSGPIFPQQ